MAINLLKTPGDPKELVNDKLRKDWNDYILFLEKKGYKGHPALDKNDLGGKMIDLYRQENPTTSISRDKIKDVQTEFSKYRDYQLNEIKNKRAAFGAGANENNFLKNLSVIDGIAGQRTTSFSFPSSYLTSFDNGKNLGTQNLGYATINKPK
jgi:hypothetical protein